MFLENNLIYRSLKHSKFTVISAEAIVIQTLTESEHLHRCLNKSFASLSIDKQQIQNHRIIKLFRLEKTFKIIKSNC